MMPEMEGLADVLYTEEDIRDRVRALGAEISRDYAGRDPVLISVLKGGAMFLADLIKAIHINVRLDFMSISAYGGAVGETGVVRILKDLEEDIVDDDVIVVEDIVDTGLTLSYLLSNLEGRGPASVEVCALLDKSVRRIAPLDIRYRGFDCPDRFVVGYGLDFEQRYRNLPSIVAVEPGRLAEDPLALLPLLGSGEPPD
jgi:hypoxanthine phosphoribosyltransferase